MATTEEAGRSINRQQELLQRIRDLGLENDIPTAVKMSNPGPGKDRRDRRRRDSRRRDHSRNQKQEGFLGNSNESLNSIGNGRNNKHDRHNRGNNSNSSSNRTQGNQDNRNRGESSKNSISGSNRTQGNRNNRNQGDNLLMGFKKLESILQNDNIDEVCVILNNPHQGFQDLLKSSTLSDDCIVLIVKIVYRMVSESILNARHSVLVKICQYFIDTLKKYVTSVPFQNQNEKFRNSMYWRDVPGFWKSLVAIMDNIVMYLPNNAVDLLPSLYDACAMSIGIINKDKSIPDEVLESLDKVQERLAVLVSQWEEQNKQKTNEENKERNDDEEFAEEMVKLMSEQDFRLQQILPTPEELLATQPPDDVRPNRILGAYPNVEAYLNIQFKLLREDFISPLRNGIYQYLNQLQNLTRKKFRKIDNIRIYNDVTFDLTPEVMDSNIVYIVNLNLNRKSMDRISQSQKRLIYGSLLVFTHDNFKTLLVGIITSRDVKLIKAGKIGVDVTTYQNVSLQKLAQNKYLMIESEIYFEPYYQVLAGMQAVNEDNMPFKKYMIHMDNNVQPPSYDPSGLLLSTYLKDTQTFDPSQRNAYLSALNSEFCIIQGPPGTGKTFIGLEIVKRLLAKRSLWYFDRVNQGCPILVVCYTNHALDQFLEGILKTTHKVIRIGSRSKNEALDAFNLRAVRRKVKSKNKTYISASFEMKNNQRSLVLQIGEIQKNLRIMDEYCCLFDIRDVLHTHFGIKIHTTDELLNWLTEEVKTTELNENFFKRSNKQDKKADDEEFLDALEDLEEDLANVDLEDENDREYINDAEDLGIFDEEILYLSNKRLYKFAYLRELTTDVNERRAFLSRMEPIDPATGEYSFLHHRKINEFERDLQFLENKLAYLNYRLNRNNAESLPKMERRHISKCLTPNQRWSIYWQCLKIIQRSFSSELANKLIEYRRLTTDFEEVRHLADMELLREQEIIGMTTTGAAKYHTVLQSIKSPILIVEEAAEVLEAHIITSLTKHTKHLILIGDHQQLRPSTAEFRLRKNFHLDVSLFERMIKNGFNCNVLGVQHRMRPEFAQLVVPAIYPTLENHPHVTNYPKVLGPTKNLYFIKHTNYELQTEDSQSKQNPYEAHFMLNFCRYLLMQGYKPENITILTTYNGQMFYLRRQQLNMPLLKGVRITVVDNYQGEENEIILLSLVRSNSERKIGYLSTDNRVNVALTRAKIGLYIIGNMDNLQEYPFWNTIKGVLASQDAISESLLLQCQIHREQLMKICHYDDFTKYCPEGGCQLSCNLVLPCGHECERICHTYDREHKENKCLKACNRIICERKHVCPFLCYRPCLAECNITVEHVLKCGHTQHMECREDPGRFKCQVTVSDVLFPCGHTNKKPCYADVEKYPCARQCEIRLDCGHTCLKTCHLKNDPEHLEYQCRKPCPLKMKNCSTDTHNCAKLCFEECIECPILVEKKFSDCNHLVQAKCSIDITSLICSHKCERLLSCGHPCPLTCGQVCDQSTCKKMVVKEVDFCKHKLKIECGKTPDRIYCKGSCPLTLDCGHKCKNRCSRCAANYNDCSLSTKCTELVPHNFEVDCNHQFNIPCFKTKNKFPKYSQSLLRHCKAPCNAVLLCGHVCVGNCGDCYQGRYHQMCGSPCGNVLACGHPCETYCRNTCPPCKKNCEYKCIHSKCSKPCGTPCKDCTEPCSWQCVHHVCQKKCGEICDRPPCEEPCNQTLPCGHACIGLCGEKCPTLCRVCNEDVVTEVFFGTEDEPDARFILLEDCNHIMEVTGMDQWVKTINDVPGNSDGENPVVHKAIKMINCPKCKTPMHKTRRYSKYIKEVLQKILKVKQKIFGNPKEIKKQITAVQIEIEELTNDVNAQFQYVPSFKEQLTEIYKKLDKKPFNHNKNKKKKPVIQISSTELALYNAKISIIKQFLPRFWEIFSILEVPSLNSQVITKYQHDLIPTIAEYGEMISKMIIRQSTNIKKQEFDDMTNEFDRAGRVLSFCKLIKSPNYYEYKHLSFEKQRIEIVNTLFKSCRYTTQHDAVVKQVLEDFRKKVDDASGLAITETEKLQIKRLLEATEGIKQSAWYECPNGHPFCIADCGGANQISKCPECKAQIGGTGHRLVQGNRHSTKMAGNVAPPWPL